MEILGIGFRAFYSKIKFPTKEVLNFQVESAFKITKLQLLLQVLRFHQGPKDKNLFKLIEKVSKKLFYII